MIIRNRTFSSTIPFHGAYSRYFSYPLIRGKYSKSFYEKQHWINWEFIDVVANPIIIGIEQSAIISQYPAALRNPSLDTTFDCSLKDRLGNEDVGVIKILVSQHGELLSTFIIADKIDIQLSQIGSIAVSVVNSVSAIIIPITLVQSDIDIGISKRNWITWSDIGSLNFAINRSNVTGEMPLNLSGFIYSIKKLGDHLVVYGEDKVFTVKAVETYYSNHQILDFGLKSKLSVAGNNSVHFFVDSFSRLWKYSGEFTLLGYKEFLLPLNNLSLTYNEIEGILYICNGDKGYVYLDNFKSMCEGPKDITGYAREKITSTTPINLTQFEFQSNIYDFGSRKNKTIQSIEVGTNIVNKLQVSIGYRITYDQDFIFTSWKDIGRKGILHFPVFGIEFIFKLRSTHVESIKIDYIKFIGVVHNYVFLDSL